MGWLGWPGFVGVGCAGLAGVGPWWAEEGGGEARSRDSTLKLILLLLVGAGVEEEVGEAGVGGAEEAVGGRSSPQSLLEPSPRDSLQSTSSGLWSRWGCTEGARLSLSAWAGWRPRAAWAAAAEGE